MDFLFQFLMIIAAIFLILLVLVQRGRGGGLAGVLGGAGGSSAFGAKAGDVFTKITIVTATIWIILCAVALAWYSSNPDAADVDVDLGSPPASGAVTAPAGEDRSDGGLPADANAAAPGGGDDASP